MEISWLWSNGYEETIRVDERFVGSGRYGNVTWGRLYLE